MNEQEPSRDALERSVEETKTNWRSSPYYAEAEGHMEAQWRDIIEPAIRGCDFDFVVELAPGHGRNTVKLVELARVLHLVDVNETCIEECRRRFESYAGPCELHYHVNDGASLEMIASDAATLVYCWDAMVHFDPPLVEAYLEEVERVLAPGGQAALHYSNYGALTDDPTRNWRDNPHWRSAMTRERFNAKCAKLGLGIVAERMLDWDGIDGLDCATLLQKPAT